MSYRDDHDAALLRVAALETELAHLRKAQTATPKAPRKRSKLPAVGLALVAITGFGALMTALHFGAAAEASAPLPAETKAAPAPIVDDLSDVRACLTALEPVADSIDATTMDPRRVDHPVSLSMIEQSGAKCRTELGRTLESNTLDPKLRQRLTNWYAAENDLANTISMITVYYGNNPVALDNYTTAPQLWTEYHRARHARDEAIAGLEL